LFFGAAVGELALLADVTRNLAGSIGADPKSVQGQMRHSRIATTMDIYAQIVPASQRRAVEKFSQFAKQTAGHLVPITWRFWSAESAENAS
jgi:integrase